MFMEPRPDVRVPEGITSSSLFSDLSNTENFNNWPVYMKTDKYFERLFHF